MLCPFCNTENDDNASVCINCGESLNTNDEVTLKTDDKESQLKEIQERRLRKNRQRKRKKILLICLAAAIVIAGACLGVYQFRSYIDRTSTDKIVTVTTTPTATPIPTETLVPTETPLPTETATPIPSETPAPTATPVAGWQTVAPQEAPATKKPTPAKTKTPVVKTAKPAKTAAPVTAPSEPEVSVSTAKPVVSSPGFESSIAASNEIPQGEPMKSQLITVSDCVTAPVSGKEIISFSIGNSKYFAYKPAEFSNTVNSSYSITAVATQDEFYGLPVYEIVEYVTLHKDEYILPQSAQKILDANDINGISKAILNLARNEIFARHGRTFKKQELQKYFESKSWYKINPDYNYTNDYSNLNETELKNALFLLEQENK